MKLSHGQTAVIIARKHNLSGVIAKRQGDVKEANYRFSLAANWLKSARHFVAIAAGSK